MKQGLLLQQPWSPCFCNHSASPLSHLFISIPIPRATTRIPAISVTADSVAADVEQLTARERRQLRNEKRESKAATNGNWREDVEERLIKKTKKQHISWKEELNLDKLALLGPQWYVIRVGRNSADDTVQRLARSLSLKFPTFVFKIYSPATQVKNKLKNGSYSVKAKPLFPGCVFLRCELNKELHDFIREYDGVGGFVGSKVGNTKRQINKPRPISPDDMEAIFVKAKEEQEKSDQAFREEECGEVNPNHDEKRALDFISQFNNDSEDIVDPQPKRRSRKSSGMSDKTLVKGSTVRVVSGTFAEFVGSIQKLNRKHGKATVRLAVLGRETLVDLDVNEIVAQTN